MRKRLLKASSYQGLPLFAFWLGNRSSLQWSAAIFLLFLEIAPEHPSLSRDHGVIESDDEESQL
ncbi:MAG: hypothetical protein CMH50_00190 [Myxococcales bacterium]|nr:hypothetical protein [Myxococcales bacterium]